MNQLGLTLFIIGLVFLIASFYIYNKSDTTAHAITYELINQCKKDYDKIKETMASNIFTVGSFNQRIEDVRSCNVRLVKELETTAEHVEAVSLRCNEVREKQMALQEKLSNKRPVIKLSEPIQFQIVEKKKGLGVKALIKEKK